MPQQASVRKSKQDKLTKAERIELRDWLKAQGMKNAEAKALTKDDTNGDVTVEEIIAALRDTCRKSKKKK